MINIALVTNTISKPGGAENVTISMYDSLRSLTGAHAFILGREEYASINMLIKWVNSDLAHEISKHYVYMRRFPLNTLLDLRKYDLVVNTRSNEVLAPAHVHYLHGVIPPYIVGSNEAMMYYEVAYGVERRHIRDIIRSLLHLVQLRVTRLVLANSRYTTNLLATLGLKAKVLHPPVRSKEVMQYINTKWLYRKRIIINISRISPEKRLEIIPLIASKIPEASFVLVGSIQDYSYYLKLMKLKKLANADNFLIIPNISRHEIYRLLNDSIIYLHMAPHETFGISIVESMAAGCIPVVYKDGGPWYDILEERDGLYGYSYNTVEETIEKIRDIISNPYRHVEVSERARLRALVFDEQIFKAKFREIIKSFLK